jgi:NAD(P)-dependent dehydrogenase (short-subunit alcohol dehydrogenase family)
MLPLLRTRSKGIPELSGKVVVITGAASGIGRALALTLHAKGCRLALVDIDAANLATLERQLRSTPKPGSVSTHVADVAGAWRGCGGVCARETRLCTPLAFTALRNAL